MEEFKELLCCCYIKWMLLVVYNFTNKKIPLYALNCWWKFPLFFEQCLYVGMIKIGVWIRDKLLTRIKQFWERVERIWRVSFFLKEHHKVCNLILLISFLLSASFICCSFWMHYMFKYYIFFWYYWKLWGVAFTLLIDPNFDIIICSLKRSRKFQHEDRLFSLSSVTSPAVIL